MNAEDIEDGHERNHESWRRMENLFKDLSTAGLLPQLFFYWNKLMLIITYSNGILVAFLLIQLSVSITPNQSKYFFIR